MILQFFVINEQRLIKRMLGYGEKYAKKVISPVMRGAAKIVLRHVRPQSPVKTGQMKKAFKVRAQKRKKGRIGFNLTCSAKEFGNIFYAAFVSLGTKTKEGAAKIIPNDFIKAGSKAAKPEARKFIQSGLKQGIKTMAA